MSNSRKFEKITSLKMSNVTLLASEGTRPGVIVIVIVMHAPAIYYIFM